jgi:hypothetical protein
MSQDSEAAVTQVRNAERERHEIEKLKQGLRYNRIKLWFTIISVLAVFVGFYLDRQKFLEQQRFDALKDREQRAFEADKDRDQRNFELSQTLDQHRYETGKDREQRTADAKKILDQHQYETTRNLDQRQYELRAQNRKNRIDRMTEIATGYDQLFGDTLESLNKDTTRVLLMRDAFQTIKGNLDTIKEQTDEIRQTRAAIERIIDQFSKTPIGLDEFVDAATLQERWAAKANALTPDLELLYGPDLAKEWPNVSKAAWQALNAKFNLFGPGSNEGLSNSLRIEGTKFQTLLRREILVQQKTQ